MSTLITGLLCLFAICVVSTGAHAETVRTSIKRADCARLTEHVPEPDVAYEPGVDVRGRRVAPADLPGSIELSPPDFLVIYLDLDLDLPLSRSRGPRRNGFMGTVAVGELIVEVDGSLYFNGQRLDDPNRSRVAAACRSLLRRPGPGG